MVASLLFVCTSLFQGWFTCFVTDGVGRKHIVCSQWTSAGSFFCHRTRGVWPQLLLLKLVTVALLRQHILWSQIEMQLLKMTVFFSINYNTYKPFIIVISILSRVFVLQRLLMKTHTPSIETHFSSRKRCQVIQTSADKQGEKQVPSSRNEQEKADQR